MQKLSDEELKHKTEEWELSQEGTDIFQKSMQPWRGSKCGRHGTFTCRLSVVLSSIRSYRRDENREGKTIYLPAYLNVRGMGVHIVTVNDYLAK